MRSNTLTFFCFTLFSILSVNAEPQLSPYRLHERRNHVPQGWSKSHKLDGALILPLRFGLTQANIESIDKFINEVAHPDSPTYGKHWTASEVVEKFAPTEESIETVRGWLIDSGIDEERIKLSTTKSWIKVNATVEEAERLLKADYHVYEHDTGKKHIACDSYHLPEHIQPHVDLVGPTVHFNAVVNRRDLEERKASSKTSKTSKNQKAPKPANPGQPGGGVFIGPKTSGVTSLVSTDLSHCDTQITPTCLRALYGLDNVTPKNPSSNSYGIVEYTPQAYIASDIDHFGSTYETDIVGKRPTLVSIDGGVVQTSETGFNYNGESNLDLQYGMALVTGAQPITLYQAGDTVEGASFNDFLDAIDGSYCTYEGGDDPTQDATYPDPYGGYQGPKACGTVKPANVISTSYSYNEHDLTPAYTARQCNEYAKLGLLGVTVLYSSGDNGVAGNGANCINPDGSYSTSGTIFNPSFPGTCPYITSVGATQVEPGHTVLNPESACSSVIYSGGGFSNYFAMPDYQKSQVTSYLTNYPPPYTGAQYNNTKTSRGFPDLSANGANYVVSVDGSFNLVYGTSASSPVVGAILTLVNDARISAGKGPIGFINPTIYSSSFASAFHDVTNGTNPGCGTKGFSATKGWDPVTGLGTPNFPKLVNLWTALP